MPDADRLLEALDPEQREVAVSLDGAVRVLAGAGTGKTRAITHRIAYGVATGVMQPTEVLAVTFTTRAAGELRQRLAGLGAHGVQARTFHSAALRQARYFWPQVFGGELPDVVKSKLALLREAVSHSRLSAEQTDLRDLAGEVEWAKVSNVRPEDYARLANASGRTVSGYDAATVGAIYAAYEDVKRSRNRIDMEDVLLCAAAVLVEDDRVAATVRRQYRWFVVDEFQDVSPIQVALLNLWLGDRDDVCVVGDPAQTIYSFAGASAEYLLRFCGKFQDAHSVTLMRNYRSTPQVVAAANTMMRPQLGQSAVELHPVREDGVEVQFHGYSDEVAEADAVASAIAGAVAEGAAPADIAVLFRINAQSEAFEDALAERSVPFLVRGAERFFERPEVKQAVALLRGAVRSSDSAETVTGELVADVTAVLSTMGWTAEPPSGRGDTRDRWESLQGVVAMAEESANTASASPPDLAGFVAELQRRAENQHAPAAAGVTLATLHAAKGLEWPIVYCVGVHEGTMPIVYAETPSAIDEERRLLYVGMTRARDRLQVSWSAARSPGGRGQRSPSRFITDLVQTPRTPSTRRSTTSRNRRRGKAMATCRVCQRPLTDPRERKLGRCVDCPSDYNEELYDALREWRRQQAEQEKFPAFCVFTDATMRALAEMQPRDEQSLARVPGIGRAKIDKYGEQVLALCMQSTEEHPATRAD